MSTCGSLEGGDQNAEKNTNVSNVTETKSLRFYEATFISIPSEGLYVEANFSTGGNLGLHFVFQPFFSATLHKKRGADILRRGGGRGG